MSYKIFVFISFLSITLSASALNDVRVIDKRTKQPIPAANICFQAIKSGRKYYQVSDKKGITQNSAKEKSILTITFLGYKTIQDTIFPNESRTYFLEENSRHIDPIICTGTYLPTAKDKSVYNVQIISSKEIQQQGATNLSDFFQTRSNIRMTYDETLGYQIEMLGMDASNVKVMFDGVPVLGRLDGNIDLGQINTSNIDHIEMVEGPMSVIYGNNALAGTINIITKTGNLIKPEIQVGTQIEHVGKYSGNFFLSKSDGNHSLSLSAFASHFNGVDFDKETRSQDWRPTTDYQLGLNYAWQKNKWEIKANTNAYYGNLLIKSDVSQNYWVYDTYYYTRRFDASAQASKNIDKDHFLKMIGSFSFYDRASQEYDKDLTTLEGTWQDKEISQNLRNGNYRMIYGYHIPNLKTEFQGGIDFNYDAMGGPRLDTATYRSIGDYAAFLTAKKQVGKRIELQSGIRYAYNTAFTSPLVYSFNLKYDLTSVLTWRISVAKGFRTPSLKELYYSFIDSNHDVHGNPDLQAEYSHHFNTSLSYQPTSYLSLKLSGYYNKLYNKIELVENSSISTLYYDYENIKSYESIGGDFGCTISPTKDIQLTLGGTVTGRYNDYSDENNSRKFNYSPDFIADASYFEPRSKIQCSINYKYNGKRPYLYSDDDETIQEGEEDAYHFMNVSLGRNFLSQHLNATLGIRNLFDVTSVKSPGANSTVHSSSTTTAITYGRSYFLQINYNF